MNCSDYPSPSKPFKRSLTHTQIRQWMTENGYNEGGDRNLFVWYYEKGKGNNLIPLEQLLSDFRDFLLS
jgi:hypothetical protein